MRRYATMVDLRLSVWQCDVDKTLRVLELLEQRNKRMPSGGVALVRLVQAHQQGRGFDDAIWERAIDLIAKPDRPKRIPLSILQRAIEIAMMLRAPSRATDGLQRAVDYGLVDVVWMDRCPLFHGIEDPRWRELRDEIAARAARVVAVFRGKRQSQPTMRGVSGSHVGRR